VGALLVGICVDPVGANAATTERLGLPFPVLSDPGGEGAVKPFAVWNEETSQAQPALIALSPGGEEIYRYVGFDQADRPDPAEALEAVRALTLGPREAPSSIHPHVEPEATPGVFRLEELAPFLRGFRSATQAMQRRRPGEEHAARLEAMAQRFLDAV